MFVMNKHHHYFVVKTDLVEVNKDKFEGCEFFDREETMLAAVCAATGCVMEEVEGATYVVTLIKGELVCYDNRGMGDVIDDEVERFISEFEV